MSSPRSGNEIRIIKYPTSEQEPKTTKEKNIATPSFILPIAWSDLGICGSISSFVITLTKNYLYLDMVSTTSVVSIVQAHEM